MITINDLKMLAKARLQDAQVLYRNKRYDAAVYMCGYAVEIALKGRICQTLKWPGFPETSAEFKSYQSYKTHDFDVLLHLSGIETRIRSSYTAEWSAGTKLTSGTEWNPELRYRPTGFATQADAQVMIAAARVLIKVI